jgi:hypothetical protein
MLGRLAGRRDRHGRATSRNKVIVRAMKASRVYDASFVAFCTGGPMRTLRLFLSAGVVTGLLATSATATPLTLQYDVTITRHCSRSTGLCSTVSIGGLELTVTTDDTLVIRDTPSGGFRGEFGPTTMTIDTSRVGDFANPFGGGFVESFQTSSIDNFRLHIGDSTGYEVGGDRDGTQSQQYLMYRWLEVLLGNRPTPPTSADVGILLAQDLEFYHSVRAKTCISSQSENCTYDPRSFDAYGVARFRESSLPPVPEPASFVLFSLGLAVIAGTRRRRRSKVE